MVCSFSVQYKHIEQRTSTYAYAQPYRRQRVGIITCVCVSRVSSLVHANECNVASYAAAVRQAAPRNSETVGGKINKNLDNVVYGWLPPSYTWPEQRQGAQSVSKTPNYNYQQNNYSTIWLKSISVILYYRTLPEMFVQSVFSLFSPPAFNNSVGSNLKRVHRTPRRNKWHSSRWPRSKPGFITRSLNMGPSHLFLSLDSRVQRNTLDNDACQSDGLPRSVSATMISGAEMQLEEKD